MGSESSAAVFIDRDGTIMEDVNYCSHPDQVKVYPGVPEALRRLQSNRFKIIVITNQSGIGRGFFTVDEYRAIESEVSRQLGDGLIAATYFCPDIPGSDSTHRKPAPGMILQAAREHQIDLTRSFFIGDKEIDVQCGHNADVRTILVQTGYGQHVTHSAANWIAKDFAAAAEIILKEAAQAPIS